MRAFTSKPTFTQFFSLHTLRARTQKKKQQHGFDDFIEWCIVFVKLITFWRRQWINYRNSNGREVLHAGAQFRTKNQLTVSDMGAYGSYNCSACFSTEIDLIFLFSELESGTHHSQYLVRPFVKEKKIAIHIDVQWLIKSTRGESGKDCEQTTVTHPEGLRTLHLQWRTRACQCRKSDEEKSATLLVAKSTWALDKLNGNIVYFLSPNILFSWENMFAAVCRQGSVSRH